MTGLETIAAAALPEAVKDAEKEIAKGLAALLGRMYDDTLSPGAKEVGGAISDLVKTMRLLAWPLQMGAALQERFRDDLFKALERVPIDRRVAPSLKIFADCCENSKFETEPTLREMWSQLLSRACDRDRLEEAHPAFPGIIKQLAVSEVIVLNAFRTSNRPVIWMYKGINPTTNMPAYKWHKSLPQDHVVRDDTLLMFVEHLAQLGLIREREMERSMILRTPEGHDLNIDGKSIIYNTTTFGLRFLKAVAEPEP